MMMRRALVAFAMVLAAGAALIQCGADAVYGTSAASPSLPRVLPRALGAAIYMRASMLVPLLPWRITAVRALVQTGALDQAAVALASLPAGPERARLEGQLAQRRGDEAAAVRAYLEAGEWPPLFAECDRLAAQGQFALGRAIVGALVERLLHDPLHPDALAEAWWRLGDFDARLGYAQPSLRARWMERSAQDYDQALALAPFNVKYLLARANRAVFLRDDRTARALFTQVLSIAPATREAERGLADLDHPRSP